MRGHPIVAALLDPVMWSMRRLRPRLLQDARGRVLEIGVGTGLNFPHYPPLTSLRGIEPDPYMLRRARRRARKLGLQVQLDQASAEALPYADGSFDTVVVTWSLCTIGEPERALREMQRVLVPDGLLLYAEHTRSHHRIAARLQDWLTPAWRRVAAGCHLNRPSVEWIRAAGFRDVREIAVGLTRWSITPIYVGQALKGQ